MGPHLPPRTLLAKRVAKKDQPGRGKRFQNQEQIIESLVEKAVRLILHKYKYEQSLSEKLGFTSVAVTKVLLEMVLGFKKLKGSGVQLTSQIDWAEVYKQGNLKSSSKPRKPAAEGMGKKMSPQQKMILSKAELPKKPSRQHATPLPATTKMPPPKFPHVLSQKAEDSPQLAAVQLLRQTSSSTKPRIANGSQRKLPVLANTQVNASASPSVPPPKPGSQKSLSFFPDTAGNRAEPSKLCACSEKATTTPESLGPLSVDFLLGGRVHSAAPWQQLASSPKPGTSNIPDD